MASKGCLESTVLKAIAPPNVPLFLIDQVQKVCDRRLNNVGFWRVSRCKHRAHCSSLLIGSMQIVCHRKLGKDFQKQRCFKQESIDQDLTLPFTVQVTGLLQH
eukprot:1143408-Pelagomonas_calceolata.AAC.2